MTVDDILIPAHVLPYVDVLGIDGAFDFLMAFGGADTYFSVSPREDNRVVQAIGRDRAIALARHLQNRPNMQMVPVAKPFLAKVMKSRGMAIAEIARQLHVDKKTARTMVSQERQERELARSHAITRQLNMFD